MRVRFRSVALASVVGVLCVVTGGAAVADEVPAGEAAALPAVACIDGVPTVPEDSAWATYGLIDDGAALGAVWYIDVGGNPTDANGWERYFQDGNALLLRWDLSANGCVAPQTPPASEVTPQAPTYWGTSDPASVYLPEAQGYHYTVAGLPVAGQLAIGPGEVVTIVAVAEQGYRFPDGATSQWTITGVPSVVFPSGVTATFYCDHTYRMLWTEGSGYTDADTSAARGWGSDSWSPMPEDATQWVAGDYVSLSVSAAEGYGVYENYLPEGWVIDGWGDGTGFQASFKIPFTGQCVPVADDATDEETEDSTEQSTDEKTVTPGHETTDPGERLPDSGADDAVQALISVGLLAAGGGLLALRRRLALG